MFLSQAVVSGKVPNNSGFSFEQALQFHNLPRLQPVQSVSIVPQYHYDLTPHRPEPIVALNHSEVYSVEQTKSHKISLVHGPSELQQLTTLGQNFLGLFGGKLGNNVGH